MNVEVKRISGATRSVLEAVAPEVFDKPIDPSRLKAYLASPDHILLAAVLSGEVVGQCAAVIHRHPDKPNELYIDEVGVTPGRQRRGIAGALMREMFLLGKSMDCQSAWLGTETDNKPARALYEALGDDGDPIVMYEYTL